MTVQLTTYASTIKSASTHSFAITIPEAAGTRVYAFCHGGIASANTTNFDISSVTLNGTSMTQLEALEYTSTNRLYRAHLYEMTDPLGGGANPTTQTFTVTYNRGLSTLGVTVIIATGVIDRGTASGTTGTTSSTSIGLSVSPSTFPGVIIAGGHVQMKESGSDSNYDDLAYGGDVTDELTKVSTGNTLNVDLAIWSGYATADILDSYDIDWSWPLSGSSMLIALPLYGQVEYAEVEFESVAPEVIYGTATLDNLTVEAEFSGDDPEVILGSIPPVQVIGRGTLFLSTASRNISVLLLATTDDLWTIADNGGNVEDLGLIVSRKKGYLTPM